MSNKVAISTVLQLLPEVKVLKEMVEMGSGVKKLKELKVVLDNALLAIESNVGKDVIDEVIISLSGDYSGEIMCDIYCPDETKDVDDSLLTAELQQKAKQLQYENAVYTITQQVRKLSGRSLYIIS